MKPKSKDLPKVTVAEFDDILSRLTNNLTPSEFYMTDAYLDFLRTEGLKDVDLICPECPDLVDQEKP